MNKLINALLNPLLYDHDVDKIELVETHISWVLLTGDFAYKIKKPVNFGFLDFSSLEKRKFYCEEELRLNRRFAPQLYLDLITITGTEELPSLYGAGEALEYAVKMKQFPSESLLSKLLDTGDLREPHMDWLAKSIADFHLHTDVAKDESSFGTIEAITQPVSENFQQIRHQIQDPDILHQLDGIEKWCTDVFERLDPEPWEISSCCMRKSFPLTAWNLMRTCAGLTSSVKSPSSSWIWMTISDQTFPGGY
jgi:aminoglycoside phosphotransferase family enzyme